MMGLFFHSTQFSVVWQRWRFVELDCPTVQGGCAVVVLLLLLLVAGHRLSSNSTQLPLCRLFLFFFSLFCSDNKNKIIGRLVLHNPKKCSTAQWISVKIVQTQRRCPIYSRVSVLLFSYCAGTVVPYTTSSFFLVNQSLYIDT